MVMKGWAHHSRPHCLPPALCTPCRAAAALPLSPSLSHPARSRMINLNMLEPQNMRATRRSVLTPKRKRTTSPPPCVGRCHRNNQRGDATATIRNICRKLSPSPAPPSPPCPSAFPPALLCQGRNLTARATGGPDEGERGRGGRETQGGEGMGRGRSREREEREKTEAARTECKEGGSEGGGE